MNGGDTLIPEYGAYAMRISDSSMHALYLLQRCEHRALDLLEPLQKARSQRHDNNCLAELPLSMIRHALHHHTFMPPSL